MADAACGPEINYPERPLTLEYLATLNEYDKTGRALEMLLPPLQPTGPLAAATASPVPPA